MKINFIFRLVWLVFGFICLTACEQMNDKAEKKQTPAITKAPVAPLKPKTLVAHEHKRVDEYYGLRDDSRSDPEIIAYLEAENAYTQSVMSHTASLQEKLFEEFKSRIKKDDSSVPYRLDNYWYYRRYEKDNEYPIYARKLNSLDGPEEILLDGNERAKGHPYYHNIKQKPSPSHKLYAFSEDTVSRRLYTIRIKDLETGKLLPDVIENTGGDIAWSLDNQYIFYLKKDLQTLLPYQVYRHKLGTAVEQDVLVYEEPDNTFYIAVYNSRSNDYIYIHCDSTLTTETRVLDASNPEGEFKIFLPRERGHEYQIEDLGDQFYIRSNWQAQNFRLMKAALADGPDKSKWREVIPNRDEAYLANFELFDQYLVLNERKDGLLKLRVKTWTGDRDIYLEPENDPAYTTSLYYNPSSSSKKLRYAYSSMTTPDTVFEYDMESGERSILKQKEVLGGFNAEDYQSERIWATARDGVKIPVSLIYRKGFKRDGTRPLYQYAYGSYGSSKDPKFSMGVISLLDRGFVHALAHVRGGQELGRQWYENGKLLKKKNTFTDFIDVTKHLLKAKYVAPDLVFAKGGSAGGLLMGAVINMEGMLYKGVIANVPFVDVITTMLDESIPLTTGEYDEWGNPNDKVYYDYMLSYSPYDQLERKDYPNLLVTSGFHDSQVQYWEPTKWVARLRNLKTDNNRLLLHTNMEAGHGGESGRFRAWRDTALEYAFMLDLAGIDR